MGATKELGIDKEFGINLELMDFVAIPNGFTSVIRGECDITSSVVATFVTTIPNAPELSLFAPCGSLPRLLTLLVVRLSGYLGMIY